MFPKRAQKLSSYQGGGVETKHDPTRRDLLKKAAYAAPVVLTLQATSALAKSGSEKEPAEATDSKKPKKAKKPKKLKKRS